MFNFLGGMGKLTLVAAMFNSSEVKIDNEPVELADNQK